MRSGQEERKPLNLTKQNDPKQNYSSLVNLKYKLTGLITANNNVYRIRKKIFPVFERYKVL